MDKRAEMGLGVRERIWFGLLIVGMLMGGFALAYVSVLGHTHDFRTPWEPPWGIFVATYEFFILCGVGLAFSAGFYKALDLPVFQRLGSRMVTIAALAVLIGLGLMGMVLTQPTRLSIASVVGPAFYHALAQGALWFGLLLGALFGLWESLSRKSRLWSLLWGCVAFLPALRGIDALGHLLTLFGNRAAWLEGGYLVEYVLVGALSGTALANMLVFLNEKLVGAWEGQTLDRLRGALGRWLLFWTLLYGLFLLTSLVIDAQGIVALPFSQHFLFEGPLAFNFWVLQVAGGVVVASALLVRLGVKGTSRIALASGLVLLGQFIRSFDKISLMQVQAYHEESELLIKQGLYTVAPCLPKLLVVVGALCLFLFLITVGEKLAHR